jgi:N-acetylglucosaminyl-diphospho-decaprenol L-rhamnosyltransferase
MTGHGLAQVPQNRPQPSLRDDPRRLFKMRAEGMPTVEKPDEEAPSAASRVVAELGIVTVSYHSQHALEGLIDSLGEGVVAPAHLVVVNNAPDDPLDLPTYSGMTVIPAPRNLGYGAGVNLGVRSLPPEVKWVLVSNPDVRLDAHALELLLDVANAEPTAGAVGPRILEPSGEIYPSARELPSLRTGVGHALFANVWLSNPWSRRYHGEYRATSAGWRETGWLSGSCQLVRRSALESVGGFDESYFMYFEDVDLGERLAKAGWRNLYVRNASVVHTGAHSTEKAASAMRAEHHRSAYQYLSRKYSAWYLWPLRVALKTALTLRARVTNRG